MSLVGRVSIDGERFFLYYHQNKIEEIFALISNLTKEDRVRYETGIKPLDINISDESLLKRNFDSRYLVEAIRRTKVSGKTKQFGQSIRISRIITSFNYAKTYTFSKEDCSEIVGEYGTSINFNGRDKNLYYEYNKFFGQFSTVKITHGPINMTLDRELNLSLKDIEFFEAKSDIAEKIRIASLNTVDFKTLCTIYDMNWYHDTVTLIPKKRYISIKTIPDIEDKVITPLVRAIKEAEARGETLKVGFDIETNGLAMCNLKKDNPAKSHCVSIGISWEDDVSYNIFTDMEHFENIPNEYVWARFNSLFARNEEPDTGETNIIDLRATISSKVSEEPKTMNSFWEITQESIEDKPKDTEFRVTETVEFLRDSILLIGHNFPIDKKGGMDYGVDIYFDEDTLQMAFVLNPRVIKGSKKLKTLTRKEFHHETPELEELLGKGNEDKFRYLTDELVAIIYGCADPDYTRQLWFRLFDILGPDLYRQYKKQDIPIMNVLAYSEYMGINTKDKEVRVLAEQTEKDIKVLEDFMYFYVGKFVFFNREASKFKNALDAGVITDVQYVDYISKIQVPADARYEFELKGNSIREVMYGVLKYPVLGFTKNEDENKRLASVDKYVMKKLLKETKKEKGFDLKNSLLVSGATFEEYNQLISDGKTEKAKRLVLIDKDKFNSLKFPLALLLQKYSEINKDYTSYYKPFRDNNLEGKIFKTNSLSRIETRRIMNPAQTMKGALKALVRSYTDDYYFLGFDMSQVEYRLMVSLAKHLFLIIKMRDPENDYHTETSALVRRMDPHMVSKEQRSQDKGVSFGKPYGLGIFRLCENMWGEVTKENLVKTKILLSDWEKANKPVTDMLEEYRNSALVEVDLPLKVRDFIDAWVYIKDQDGKKTKDYLLDANGEKIPSKIGMIKNELGFYRLFDLDDNDESKEASIKRMAGNYPIQSFAAEIFRTILMRFYRRCVKEGLKDKIIWHLLIHDELIASVHKSVNVFLLYKIIYEECMIILKGHTRYYIGINVGETWEDTKSDKKEAPIHFVSRMIKRWDAGEFKDDVWIDNAWEYVKPHLIQYYKQRIGEVVKTLIPNLSKPETIIDMVDLLKIFKNYVVRNYVKNNYNPNHFVKKPENEKSESQMNDYEDRVWASKFESWLLDYFGEGKLVRNIDGEVYKVVDKTYEIEEKEIEETMDLDALFGGDESDSDGDSGDFFDLETGQLIDTYNSTSTTDYQDIFQKLEEPEEEYDEALVGTGTDVAKMVVYKTEYKNLMKVTGRLLITIDNTGQLNKCKKYLQDKVYNTGYTITFKTPLGIQNWLKVDSALDVGKLDELLEVWKYEKN